MTTPLQVDVTALIVSGLRAELGLEVRCVTELPADLTQALPVVRVERAGGGDDGVLLDSLTVVLDCMAGNNPDGSYTKLVAGGVGSPQYSREFAYRVIGAMYALQGKTINGAAFSYVRKIGGPIPLPYENPAVRRQGLTFRVSVLAL